MNLTNSILNDPLGIALVTVLVVAAWYYQRTLSWPEYQRIHSLKVKVAPVLDPYIFATSEKAYRNESPEYLTTYDGTPREVFEALVENGGSPHLINSVKYRQGRDFMDASVVFPVGGQEQTEAYFWGNGDGTTDIYTHCETSVIDVDGHLEEGGIPGDPRGIVRDALGVRYD